MDAHEVVDFIAAGGLDGHIDEAAKALVARVQGGHVDIRWRIRFAGDEWTHDTATLGELFEAQQRAGLVAGDRSLRRKLNPVAFEGDLVALLVAHLVKVGGHTLDEAIARVEKITRADVEVDEYEVASPKGDVTSAAQPSS